MSWAVIFRTILALGYLRSVRVISRWYPLTSGRLSTITLQSLINILTYLRRKDFTLLWQDPNNHFRDIITREIARGILDCILTIKRVLVWLISQWVSSHHFSPFTTWIIWRSTTSLSSKQSIPLPKTRTRATPF